MIYAIVHAHVIRSFAKSNWLKINSQFMAVSEIEMESVSFVQIF